VRAAGYRISTGFVGTPLICDALCGVGAYDTAFRLLMQRACPSWLFPVSMGATTIWERWDSMLPDGSINPGEMTSFNHYALGAVADWLHRKIAGLAPAEPGYKRIEVRPLLGGGLTMAHARQRTPYGMAEVAWRIDGDQVQVTVVVPPNTSAEVTLPMTDSAPLQVASGTHRWAYAMRAASRPPLTVDDLLVEFIEDPPAWNVVVRAAPELSAWERGLHGRHDVPLRQIIAKLPRANEVLPIVQEALQAMRAAEDVNAPA
jgi:alpha-L-rhamnosidase